METVTATWRVLETTGQQIIITLRLHNDNTSAKIETYFLFLCGKKNEIDSSCHKWTEYKRPWFHSYFIILSIVSHHYGSSSQTTTCPGVNLVRWSTEYCSTPASASTSHPSAQVEAAATMVVSTVVAETTSIWAIRASYGGNEDWRSGLISKLCQVRTCNVSRDGGQADTSDLQARH